MKTAFRQLCDAIVGGLKQAPAVAGGRVGLPRRVPVPEEWPNFVEVRQVAADRLFSDVPGTAPVDWATTISLDLHSRPPLDGDVDDDMDALLLAVHERLRSLDLSPLGVIDMDSAQRVDWDSAQGATPLAEVSLQIVIRHRTVGTALQPAA